MGYWTLNEFRKRHPKALNDLFTQVVEAVKRRCRETPGQVSADSGFFALDPRKCELRPALMLLAPQRLRRPRGSVNLRR